jgi:uncharacterized protein
MPKRSRPPAPCSPTPRPDGVLAVAALSARTLAQWAAEDGRPAIALDVFGDADTRRAAASWHPIGHGTAIAGETLLAALKALGRQGQVTNWVAGSGFDGSLDLLEAADAVLPRVGTAVERLRWLADPRRFFVLLDALRIAHPPVRFDCPGNVEGWLRKQGGGSGGWQVRRASGPESDRRVYWQRERRGRAMSATFVANGEDAVVLGFNRLLTRPIGEHPYVFRGVVGPVPVDEAVQRTMSAALRALVSTCRLRGLGSLDFIVGDDGRADVLELNARPPASAALYPRIDGGSPLQAHLRACVERVLPAPPLPAAEVRGLQIVYAPQPMAFDAARAAAVAAFEGASDLPAAGQRFGAGEPVCSVAAQGRDADAVEQALAQREARLLQMLENPT